jgi:hypothetical protein
LSQLTLKWDKLDESVMELSREEGLVESPTNKVSRLSLLGSTWDNSLQQGPAYLLSLQEGRRKETEL